MNIDPTAIEHGLFIGLGGFVTIVIGLQFVVGYFAHKAEKRRIDAEIDLRAMEEKDNADQGSSDPSN